MRNDPTTTPTARLIMAELQTTPGTSRDYASLVNYTGASLDTVRETVRNLAAAGLVTKTVHKGVVYVSEVGAVRPKPHAHFLGAAILRQCAGEFAHIQVYCKGKLVGKMSAFISQETADEQEALLD